MKTIIAAFLGLAALATSFVGSSLAYADALEAESSTLPVLASGADVYGAANWDELHCVLYSDGADNCVVNPPLEMVDPQSTVVGEIDPPPTESAPIIQFVDAIPVVVVQTVTIAAPGSDAAYGDEPAYTGSIPVPSATEPPSNLNAEATIGASSAPAAESADAIVVAIVQSATVVVPGQNAREETPSTELQSEPGAPTAIPEVKMGDRDPAE